MSDGCPENRIPFPRPAHHDPDEFLLLVRIFAAGWRETFRTFDPLPNRKTNVNNHGPMSTNHIVANYEYPEASYTAGEPSFANTNVTRRACSTS